MEIKKMSDIGTKTNVTDGAWVFQADIAIYNLWEEFQEGKIVNWEKPTKKNKAPGQIILFRQVRAPSEKRGIYGVGELLDTNYIVVFHGLIFGLVGRITNFYKKFFLS
jgi:hypothetical protein